MQNTTRTATEAQLKYISNLCNTLHGPDNGPEAALAYQQNGEGTLTTHEASRIITSLRAQLDATPKANTTPTPAPAEAPALTPGMYVCQGVPVKVYQARSGTHLLAKMLLNGEWVYKGGAARHAAKLTRMTEEQAADYGKRTGVCCCCGRDLSNPESITAGIGPICRGKFF